MTPLEIVGAVAYLLIGTVSLLVFLRQRHGQVTAFDLLIALMIGWLWPIFVPMWLLFTFGDKLIDKLDTIVIWRRK